MKHRILLTLALAVGLGLGAAGCGGSGKVRVGKTTQVEEVRAMDPTEVLKANAAMLPADTVAVAIVDMDYLMAELLTDGMGMLPEDWDTAQMDTDLAELSIRHLGVDFTQAHTMVMALTEDKEVFVLLQGELEAPQGGKPFEHASLKVQSGVDGVLAVEVAAPGSVMLVFDPDHLGALAAVLDGKEPALAGTPAMDRLMVTMGESGPGVLVLGATPGQGAMSQELLAEMSEFGRFDGAAITIADRVGFALQGDAQAVESTRKVLSEGLSGIRMMLAEEMARLDDKSFFEGFLAIVGYHTIMGIEGELQPEIKGDMLSLHVGMPSVDSLVPFILTMSVAAVPALVAADAGEKFDPSAEAQMNLQTLVDSAVAFYEADRVGDNGEPITTRRFPASTPVTPWKNCCRINGGPDFNNNNRCDANPGIWDARGWEESQFMVIQEHHYVYELVNNDKLDKESELTIRALGDRDCDGVMEIFSVKLSIDAETGEVIRGEVQIENEGE